MTKRILIVEDNAMVRELFRSALKPLGCACLETPRGELAFEIAKRERPHLIILDLLLPDLPGQSVIQRLKSDAVIASIPVLAVTNAATMQDEPALKAQGFAGLVTKPVNIQEFCNLVGRFLRT